MKFFNRRNEYEKPVDAVAETPIKQESWTVEKLTFITFDWWFNLNRLTTLTTNNMGHKTKKNMKNTAEIP